MPSTFTMKKSSHALDLNLDQTQKQYDRSTVKKHVILASGHDDPVQIKQLCLVDRECKSKKNIAELYYTKINSSTEAISLNDSLHNSIRSIFSTGRARLPGATLCQNQGVSEQLRNSVICQKGRQIPPRRVPLGTRSSDNELSCHLPQLNNFKADMTTKSARPRQPGTTHMSQNVLSHQHTAENQPPSRCESMLKTGQQIDTKNISLANSRESQLMSNRYAKDKEQIVDGNPDEEEQKTIVKDKSDFTMSQNVRKKFHYQYSTKKLNTPIASTELTSRRQPSHNTEPNCTNYAIQSSKHKNWMAKHSTGHLHHALDQCSSVSKKQEMINRWRYSTIDQPSEYMPCPGQCFYRRSLLARCFLAWANRLSTAYPCSI